MYKSCPKCKSKNTKCIKTDVNNIRCKCLECDEEFNTLPGKKEEVIDFNG